MLEAAGDSAYEAVLDDMGFANMNKNREDIPWRVAARVFSIMDSIARENGIDVKNVHTRPMQGDSVYERLNGHFLKKDGPEDEWVWLAEYVIRMLDDDYWSLKIEFNLGTTKRGGDWVSLIRSYSMFRCDDIRGIEAAMSDIIKIATTKSREIISAFTELSDTFHHRAYRAERAGGGLLS